MTTQKNGDSSSIPRSTRMRRAIRSIGSALRWHRKMRRGRTKKLRFFLDTEFNEHAARNKLDPISVALVPEDETKPNFYGVSNEYNAGKITPWLNDNVVKHLPPADQRKSEDEIRQGITDYINSFDKEGVTSVEIWAYNGSTDFTVLSNFFGSQMGLRKAFTDAGLPRPEFRDVKELMHATKGKKLPAPENAHDSLQDTIWTRAQFKYLKKKLKKSQKFLVE